MFKPLVVGAVVLAFGFVASPASGQSPSLADPNPFFERHGIQARIVPFVEAENVKTPQGQKVAGMFTTGGITISTGLGPVYRIRTGLHEWLHAVSAPAWDGVQCESVDTGCCDPAFLRWYEEGLVEAVTLHLLPGYGRWLLGHPMGAETIAIQRAWPAYSEANRWLRAATTATGTPRWSRESREWLVNVLRMTPLERVAVLTNQ